MMKNSRAFAAVVLSGAAVLALAGCEPASPEAAANMGMVTPAMQDQLCLDAVKAETGISEASVQTSDHEGGIQEIVGGVTYDSVVTVGVGTDGTAYHCLVNNDGEVGDIHRVSGTHAPS